MDEKMPLVEAFRSTVLPSRILHFTRQDVEGFIERFDIVSLEKITNVFAGLPCRTVKVFPLPEDFTTEKLFSNIPGYVVATLTVTENNGKAMFVTFSDDQSVYFALNETAQFIKSFSDGCNVLVQVLPDSEFLKFLHDLVLEFDFRLEVEKKKLFELPDARRTTLSAELDIFLSALKSTLQREKQKTDVEKPVKLAASAAGSEKKKLCPKHRKRNKFEIAYDKKEVKEFDLADHLPNCILPHPDRIKRLMEMRGKGKKTQTRFSFFKWITLVAASTASCLLFHQMTRRVGAIAEPTNYVQRYVQ